MQSLTPREAINGLKRKLEEVRKASAPPKKFAFKRINRPAPASEIPETKEQTVSSERDQADEDVKKSALPPPAQPASGFRLASLDATHYVLQPSTIEDVSIASLEAIKGSVVDVSIPSTITTSFATLKANNVQGSLLMCGTITGSAHVTGLQNSTLVISARQLRVHKSKNVVIYLHCSSRPIIEDCSEIRFAPLPATFVRLTQTTM